MMSEKQERQITFTITEGYIARYLAACDTVGIRGVGSLINLNIAKDCEVTVYPGSLRCSVYWETKKEKHREVLWYDSMPVSYELSDGILLRLSKVLVLFLPITHDPHSNRSLHWMREQLRRSTTEAPTFGVLTGEGIGRLSRMKDAARVRSRQRPVTPLFAGLVGIWLLPLVFALVFFYGTWHSGPVSYGETIPYTGALQSYYTTRHAGRGGSHTYLDLEGREPFSVAIPRDSDALKALQPGTEVRVALHPRTDEVMEIIVGDDVLASFDEAYAHLNRMSSVMAVVGFVCLVFGIYFVFTLFPWSDSKETHEKRSYYDRNLEYERQHNRGTPGRKRRKRK